MRDRGNMSNITFIVIAEINQTSLTKVFLN